MIEDKIQEAKLHYSRAVSLHKQGELEGAMDCLQRAIALQPNYAKAYFGIGLILDQKGELEGAISQYRQAIALEPDYRGAYNNLGCALMKQRNYLEAIEVLKQALEIDPVGANLYNNLGKAYSGQGLTGEAFTALRRALELDPKLALAYQNLGELWRLQKNYEEAQKCYQELIALEPNNIKAYSDLGLVLMNQGKLEEAMGYLGKAIAPQKRWLEAYCLRAKLLRDDSLLNRAKIACAGFLQELLKYNSLIDQETKIEKIENYLYQIYADLGQIIAEYGGIEKAEIYYRKALQIKPDAIKLYLLLGSCLEGLGRLDTAATVYHLGLNIAGRENQENQEICFRLGNILAKQGKLERAIAYYEDVLKLQESGQDESWQNLPSSSQPSFEKPQAIYSLTRDWLENKGLPGAKYLEVVSDSSNKEIARKISQPIYPERGINTGSKGKKSTLKCGGVTCPLCMNRLIKEFKPVKLEKGVYVLSFSEKVTVEPVATFVSIIPGGRAWIAPQTSEWMICKAMAIITGDNYLLGDLSRFYNWYLPGCQRHDFREHDIFKLESLPPIKNIEGRVAVLSSLSAQVYYHWLIDALPRFGVLRQGGINFQEIDWFVVNSLAKPFQRETLAVLGIPEEKIIESDRLPHLKATELIVPSFPGHLDWVPRETIEFLRQNFLAPFLAPVGGKNYPQRIYISRVGAKYRQVLNEKEVIDFLQPFDFQVVLLEKMSVKEQAALFAAAKIIVAPHGAGLTNLVFCTEGTKIVEFFSPRYLRTDYWMVSQELGLEHYYLTSEDFPCYPIRQLMYTTPLTEDITIDLAKLELVLSMINH